MWKENGGAAAATKKKYNQAKQRAQNLSKTHSNPQ